MWYFQFIDYPNTKHILIKTRHNFLLQFFDFSLFLFNRLLEVSDGCIEL